MLMSYWRNCNISKNSNEANIKTQKNACHMANEK